MVETLTRSPEGSYTCIDDPGEPGYKGTPKRVSVTDTEPPRPTQAEFAYLRDYAVANRAMTFWLDPNVPGEAALFEQIMAETDPPTPYLGWFAQDIAGEFAERLEAIEADDHALERAMRLHDLSWEL